jgi:hypothetical protein
MSLGRTIKYLDLVYGRKHRTTIKNTLQELGRGAGYALRS